MFQAPGQGGAELGVSQGTVGPGPVVEAVLGTVDTGEELTTGVMMTLYQS